MSNVVTVRAYGSYVDKGPVRPLNEDVCLIDAERLCFGVADGYGGNGIGDVAARQALEKAAFFVKNGLGDSEVTLPFIYRSYLTDAGNLVFNAFLFANQVLVDENRKRHINGRGGASALFAFASGNKLVLGSCGSCQAFLVRRGRVQAITKARSYNSARGQFQGSWNGKWAFPLMALGHALDLEPEIFELQMEKGDLIILATDGIYPRLAEDDFAESFRTLRTAKSLDLGLSEQNRRLAEIATQKGGADNQALISLVCG